MERFVPSCGHRFRPSRLEGSCRNRRCSSPRSMDSGRGAGCVPLSRSGLSGGCTSASWPGQMMWRQVSRCVCASVCHLAVVPTVSTNLIPRFPRTIGCTAYRTQASEPLGGDSGTGTLIVCLLHSRVQDSRGTDGLQHVDPLGFPIRLSITHARKRRSFNLAPGASLPQQSDQHTGSRAECVRIKNARSTE